MLVQHGWGVLPGRMHNESKELRGSGVLRGHILYRNAGRVAGEYSPVAWKKAKTTYAWLGSTPRPDAETNTHEMHGWGVLPGQTSA